MQVVVAPCLSSHTHALSLSLSMVTVTGSSFLFHTMYHRHTHTTTNCQGSFFPSSSQYTHCNGDTMSTVVR